MAYKVIQAFTDLKDGNRVYRVGDTYEGKNKTRIKELLSKDSKGRHSQLKGKVLIESDGTDDEKELDKVVEDVPKSDGEKPEK